MNNGRTAYSARTPGQRDESWPGNMVGDQAGHNLKFKNCLFLEFSFNIFGVQVTETGKAKS